MKHCKMYFAGYKHLAYDRTTHTHRLLNLRNHEIEIWELARGRDRIGIPYKNSLLQFKRLEQERDTNGNH